VDDRLWCLTTRHPPTQAIYGAKPIYSWAKPEEFMDEVLYAWLDEHIREEIRSVSHLNEWWLCTFIDCHQIVNNELMKDTSDSSDPLLDLRITLCQRFGVSTYTFCFIQPLRKSHVSCILTLPKFTCQCLFILLRRTSTSSFVIMWLHV
jgi:hypothetical protein